MESISSEAAMRPRSVPYFVLILVVLAFCVERGVDLSKVGNIVFGDDGVTVDGEDDDGEGEED